MQIAVILALLAWQGAPAVERERGTVHIVERLGGRVDYGPKGAVVRVVLKRAKLDETALKSLPALTSLQELDLYGSTIGDDGAKYLASFQQLAALNLHYTGITATGLKALTALPALTSLDVSGNFITDDGLETLSSMKLLTSLNLTDTGGVLFDLHAAAVTW